MKQEGKVVRKLIKDFGKIFGLLIKKIGEKEGRDDGK